MKMSSPLLAVLLAAMTASAAAAAPAPAPANDWPTWGYDAERTGWNRGETTLSKDNVGRLKVQWSTQLSTPPEPVVLSTLTAPVVAAGVQTPRGMQNLLFVLGADDVLFALDADSGREVWRKAFPNPVQAKKAATWLCSNTANATPVIDKARGLIFLMASDGKLRAHSLADGAERMVPVQMVPPFARAWSLNLFGDVIYTTSGRACGEVQDPRDMWGAASLPIRRAPTATQDPVQTEASAVTAVYVADLAKPEVSHFFTSGGRPAGPWGRGGLARGPADHLILQTSDGLFDPASGNWGDTILKLSPRAARVTDSFTPENHRYIQSKDLAGSATPVVFPFGDKTLVATAQKESVLYLLDANDMGGGIENRHQKYVFKSPLLANEIAAGTDPSQGVWGAIATYLTPGGKRFLYVPFWGPQASTAPTFPVTNGTTPNGGVMAFEVVQRGDQIVAEPRWTSDNMIMADPPVVANGVVFATSTGGQPMQNPRGPDGARIANTTPESIRNRSTPIGNLTLFAYDAETGKRLYTSGKTIPGWVHFGEPVVALGKVFLVTHDARIYAFGLDR
jgi:outer membrane protein assembly factor BamB